MAQNAVARLPRTRSGRPTLRRTYDVLDYWAERIELVAPKPDSFSYSSMICRGDSLYHYGLHFELAEIIRDKRGRTRLVLLNGDTYAGSSGFGPSTASRQADARNAVARTNAPSVVVPFSALAGAGIDSETIMPLHVRDDRFTIEQHSSRKQPTTKLLAMCDPSGATETVTGWGRDPQTGDYHHNVEQEVPVYVEDPNQTRPFSSGHGWANEGATRDENGVWHWEIRRHWLGDSIFRARCTETRTRKATAEELERDERFRAWEREATRLREAERVLQRRIWAIQRRGEKRDYRQLVRLTMALEGFEQARNALERPEQTNVRDGRVAYRVTRWATFLSSFDYQESSPLYFLCELPHGAKPNTVEEAIELLKPPEVLAAEARGLKVLRQGDLFAIPTKLSKRQIRRMRGRGDFTKHLRVLGTNHSVTEGIVCKGGAVLGRGVMRHEPEGWRPPDHARRKLGDGKTWHLLVRNTVPRTR